MAKVENKTPKAEAAKGAVDPVAQALAIAEAEKAKKEPVVPEVPEVPTPAPEVPKAESAKGGKKSAKADQKAKSEQKSYKVLKPFRSVLNYDNAYEVDDDFKELSDEDRVKDLVRRGFIK